MCFLSVLVIKNTVWYLYSAKLKMRYFSLFLINFQFSVMLNLLECHKSYLIHMYIVRFRWHVAHMALLLCIICELHEAFSNLDMNIIWINTEETMYTYFITTGLVGKFICLKYVHFFINLSLWFEGIKKSYFPL